MIDSLTLSKNNIPLIRSEALVELKNLGELYLDNNNITRIGRFAFKGLPKLRKLSIQNTSLNKLEKFSFSGLQNLTFILLNDNRIRSIEESAFAGSFNIRMIFLHHNPIHIVQSKAFANLRNVEHLIFPSGIRTLESDAFNGLDSVGLIKLPFMDLIALEAYTFRGLSYVHVLSIQESDLGVVKPNVFHGLTNVGSLNVINNKIDHLQELKIVPENKIKIFRLLGNHVLQTPVPGNMDVRVVENFTVIANHFPCDCRIHAILDGPLANGTSYNFLSKNFCISPLEMNGKPMSNISVEDVPRCSNEYNLDSWDAATSTERKGMVMLYFCVISLLMFVCC